MKQILVFGIGIFLIALAGCTEEQQNRFFRQADNILGKDLRVSYVDEGKIVKSWTVRSGKITTGKDASGQVLGYYYFWSEETGYVQLPIERTLIEEVKAQ